MGIIIVFVTLLFGMKYTAIVNALTEECPEGPKAKSSLKRRLRSSIATNCLPVLFFNMDKFSCVASISYGAFVSL